jgi:hypothetical protein
LKPYYDVLASNFAFNFNLRRHNKGRMRLQRDAFQRVGRNLATTGPPEHRLPAPPFLPQVLEHVVLSRAGALLAYRRLGRAVQVDPMKPELKPPGHNPGTKS